MKNLFILLLLIILSARGIAVAAGGEIVHAEPASPCMVAPASDSSPSNSQVMSSIEEMSDYVLQQPDLRPDDARAPQPRHATLRLLSIILPTALPPPRS